MVDAYPTLCRIYAIAVVTPISSSTAERSFSALKRVKTRIRSSMVQEKLESLLSMSIERKILLKCDKERSPEQSKALLWLVFKCLLKTALLFLICIKYIAYSLYAIDI